MSLGDELQATLKGSVKASDAFWYTDFLVTGIPPLDYALGGGFGYGRVAELFGPWSSGKTMVLYHALATNQRNGGISVLFEAEGAFSPDFYAALGGDPSSLLIYPVDTVEDVFDGMLAVCKKMEDKKNKGNNTPVAIGWDSIAATGTKHLQDVGMDKRDMSKSGAMSAGSQLIVTAIKRCRVAIISTNQIREQIGSYDSATHTPGGKAWPFICSQRVELAFDGGTAGSKLTSYDIEVGRWTRGQVVKNKLASPFGKFTLPIFVQEGHDHPELKGEKTKLGIDVPYSLFYAYLRNQILLPGRIPVVSMPANGWYEINATIAPGYKKFQKGDWLEVLAKFPKLGTLPYDLLCATDTGTPPAPGTEQAPAAP